MKLEILKKTEKEKIREQLEKQFGISKLPYLFTKNSKDKIRGFTGNLSKEEILRLARETNMEVLGLYLFKDEKDGIRLSIDACHALKDEIKKNIIELNDAQALEWFKGHDLDIKSDDKGYKILKYKDDFIGCGKLSQSRLVNFVPKERRIKS